MISNKNGWGTHYKNILTGEKLLMPKLNCSTVENGSFVAVNYVAGSFHIFQLSVC